MTREEFKKAVFSRDRALCVVCKDAAVDAHHIIDRSLFDDGGYHIDNGISLCSEHHLKAERTLISCQDLRDMAFITHIHQPDHFYQDERYDHWGNILLPSGMRIKGELFGEPRVQKILKEAGVLSDFLKYIKYPRTYHCPWSPNLQNDDRRHENVNFFIGKEVVVTVKLDGENTSMYPDYIHARSLDSRHHESRSWVKALHGSLKHNIPDGFRICGENMYAEHSIHYTGLESYFFVFSIWDANNVSLSWDDVGIYSDLLGLKTVPVLCRFVWQNEQSSRDFIEQKVQEYKAQSGQEVEGYVIRTADPISYKDFRRNVAKMVRKGHVQTNEFWMARPVVPNELGKTIYPDR